MSTINPAETFVALCRLADEKPDDELFERIKELHEQGIDLRVETSLEDPEFITDPSQYTEVNQNCEIWIGNSKVYEWQETYWGSFGGMGAGWWVEQGDTSIDVEVQTLLELLDLLPDTPEVPPPHSSGNET